MAVGGVCRHVFGHLLEWALSAGLSDVVWVSGSNVSLGAGINMVCTGENRGFDSVMVDAPGWWVCR